MSVFTEGYHLPPWAVIVHVGFVLVLGIPLCVDDTLDRAVHTGFLRLKMTQTNWLITPITYS